MERVHLRRGDAALRVGPPRPPAGRGDPGPHRGIPRLRVQGLRAARSRAGGVVRAIKASGEFPRSRFDELTEQAQDARGEGPRLGASWRPGGWRSPIAKFLSEDEMARARRRSEPSEGDAILIVADRAEVAARVLGALRVRGGRAAARGARHLLGGRLPDVRVERGRGPLGRAAPPVHLPDGRPRRRPRHLAQPRLRRGAERLGARRRLDPDQPPRRAAARCSTRSASGPTRRASASASCSRRSATARRRTAGSPSGSTASSRCSAGRGVDPRRDPVPEDGERRGPDDGRARPGRRAPAARARRAKTRPRLAVASIGLARACTPAVSFR